MKSFFVACCVVLLSSTSVFSQSSSEEELFQKLSKGDAKSLDVVLKTPEGYSAIVLFAGAGVAFKEKKLEDSAFLFYAGQLRMRFDQKCFPPKGTGGDNPLVFYTSLAQRLGKSINPAIMAEPKAFAKSMERIEKWSPQAPKDYTPGYEFTERLSEQDAHEAAKPHRVEFVSRMGDLAKLLNNEQYFAAFRVLQAYNLAADAEKRPTKEENDKATETMKRIEQETGLKGIFTK